MVAGAISELVGDAKMSANPGVSGNGPFHGMSEEVGQAASLVDLSARRAVEHDGVNLVIVEHPARDVFGEVSAWAVGHGGLRDAGDIKGLKASDAREKARVHEGDASILGA